MPASAGFPLLALLGWVKEDGADGNPFLVLPASADVDLARAAADEIGKAFPK